MAITAEQEQKLRELLRQKKLPQHRLDDEEPWGEDGVMEAFERGQDFGSHELAEAILEVIGE